MCQPIAMKANQAAFEAVWVSLRLKEFSRRGIQTKSCRPRASRSVVMRSKTLHCHQGSGTKIPSHRVHFAMQRSVANTTVGARSRKLGRQRRYPSGPQKYAVDVRRVGEVPSVRMCRLHRFQTFSCLCANNSLTGVRLECSRLRTMLARTRADNPDKFNERT